jgi:two-component system, cell cycle sensor histidine kinase and response regulator CckA
MASDLFHRVLDSLFAFVGIYDLEGRIIDCNTAPLEAAGLTRDVLGTPFADTPWFAHSEVTRERIRSALRRSAAGETVREDFDAMVLGGLITVDASFTPLRDDEGVIRWVVGSAVDITERKRQEVALRETNDRLRQVTENMREVFWVFDPTTAATLYLSPAYERVWGRSRDALVAAPNDWLEAVHRDDVDRVRAGMRRTPGPFEHEYRIVRPDGAIRWIRDHGTALAGDDGRLSLVVGVSEDVTERHLLEAQLRQAQKMESLGQLAAGVAHDFNNLLTVVATGVEQLDRELEEPELDRELVEEIVTELGDAAERAAGLTRQLLLFGRQQVLTPKVIDLNELIQDASRLLQRLVGEDVVLTTSLCPQIRPVEIDPGSLTQVLMNLAVNARDAMPGGGELTIATGEGEREGRHWVRLHVRDTGPGIEPAVRARLFEPFFTTKPAGKGTGLGLAVVHGIVEQSGGRIAVDSRPGHGADFAIELPAAEDGRPRRVTSRHSVVGGGHEAVLVVEDDDQVRRMSVRGLRRSGYHVEQAANADEALRLLLNQRFDLLITDVVMPGMNGRELADAVRRSQPAIKVLYTSGYTDDAVIRRGVVRDEVEFLPKPYTALALLGKVRGMLDAR